MLNIQADNITIYLPKKYFIPYSDSTSDNKSNLEFLLGTNNSLLIRFFGNFTKNKNIQSNPRTRFDIYIQLEHIDSILGWLQGAFGISEEIDSNEIIKVSSSAPESFRKGWVSLPKISSSHRISISRSIVRSFECTLNSYPNHMYVEIEENRPGVHKYLKGEQLHFAVRCEIEDERKRNAVLGLIYIENPCDLYCVLKSIKLSKTK